MPLQYPICVTSWWKFQTIGFFGRLSRPVHAIQYPKNWVFAFFQLSFRDFLLQNVYFLWKMSFSIISSCFQHFKVSFTFFLDCKILWSAYKLYNMNLQKYNVVSLICLATHVKTFSMRQILLIFIKLETYSFSTWSQCPMVWKLYIFFGIPASQSNLCKQAKCLHNTFKACFSFVSRESF